MALGSNPCVHIMNTAAETIHESEDTQELLKILEAVEADPSVSQRAMSSDIGIALGMVNSYIQRCVRKGWIKTQKIPARRYAYYLTPQGMSEKTRLVRKYMQSSFSLYRQTRNEAEALFQALRAQNIQNIALVGSGDVQDIVSLIGRDMGFQIEEMNVIDHVEDRATYVITDMDQPQATYDRLSDKVGVQKVYALPLLRVKLRGQNNG